MALPKINTTASKAKLPPVQTADYTYRAETFATEHHEPRFKVVDDVQAVIDRFSKVPMFVFDTETHATSLSHKDIPTNIVRRYVGSGKNASPQDFPFCVSFSDGEEEWTIYDHWEDGLEKIKQLSVLFENPKITKIAHNLKYDMHMLYNAGMKVVGPLHDTLIISRLVDENRPSHTLKALAEGIGNIKYENMVDFYKKQHKVVDYSQIPKDLLGHYANADVYNCWQVFQRDYKTLEQEGLLDYYKLEMDLLVACFEMERVGMRVDMDYEQPLKQRLVKEIDDAEKLIYETAGNKFNINSGAQIHSALLKLGYPESMFTYTDKGNVKLDKHEMNRLAEEYNIELIQQILAYRKAKKLLDTYAVGIYNLTDSVGRVHANINTNGADTGRFSVTAPALQTLGKKDTTIRQAFIPEDNFSLVFMDLDSIEYKLYAHYSKIDGLIDNMINGYDAHTATAALLYGVELDEVTKEQRTLAKTVNFALLYGSGNATLAKNIGCTTQEAGQLKLKYFNNLPGSQQFVQTVQQVCRSRGFIKLYLGRRRRLSPNDCYKAVNSLMQGGCACYIKQAMVRIHKYLKHHGYQSRMIMCVHDEIVFELHNDEKETLMPILRGLMENHLDFRVPITAGVELGSPHWGSKDDVTDKYAAYKFTQAELDEIDSWEV